MAERSSRIALSRPPQPRGAQVRDFLPLHKGDMATRHRGLADREHADTFAKILPRPSGSFAAPCGLSALPHRRDRSQQCWCARPARERNWRVRSKDLGGLAPGIAMANAPIANNNFASA
jgi:hypothetical protein